MDASSLKMTAEELTRVVNSTINELQNYSNLHYNRTHYRQYNQHSYLIAEAFRELHKQFSLFSNLNIEDAKFIDEVDLFGFLHIHYHEARNETSVQSALTQKALLLELHKHFNSYIETNSKESLAWRKLVEFNNQKEQVAKNKLSEQQLTPGHIDKIYSLFEVEYEIIIKVLSGSDLSYKDIISQMARGLDLCKVILTDPIKYQQYEDTWIASRSLEQVPMDFFVFVDDISYLAPIPLSKDKLSQIRETIVKSIKLKVEGEEVVLTEDTKKSIETEASNLAKTTKPEQLKYYFKFLNFLLPSQIEAISNLITLYKLSAKEIEKGELYYYSEFVSVDQQMSVALNFTEFINLLQSAPRNPDDFMKQFSEQFSKIINAIDDETLINIFEELKKTLDYFFLTDADIFYEDDSSISALKFLLSISENFDLYHQIFSNDFEQMSFNFDASSIIRLIETRLTTRLKLINKVLKYDDQTYSQLRREHNDKLFQMIPKVFELKHKYLENKTSFIKALKILVDNDIYLPNEEELNDILAEEYSEKIPGYIKNLATSVADEYSKLLKQIDQSGIKDINLVSLGKTGSEPLVKRYNDLQTCIVYLRNVGAYFNLVDLDYKYRVLVY